ncbi:MAG: hypothetical protein WA952_14305 [Lewinella sp.]
MVPPTLDSGLLHATTPTDPQQIADINDLKIQLNYNRRKILYGRYTLLAVAALGAFAALMSYGPDAGQRGITLVLGASATIYLLCALVTFRYHLAGIATGLGIYLIDHLSNLYLDPAQLAQGWMTKVAIVTGLALGLHAALERRKLIRKLSDLPVKGAEVVEARKLRDLRRTPHGKRARI